MGRAERLTTLEEQVADLTRRLEALETLSPGQYEPGSEPDLDDASDDEKPKPRRRKTTKKES